MNYAKIIGTGSYLPEKILKNTDLVKYFDTSDEWIVSRTGIKQRHIAKDDQSCTDLAEQAALNALNDANISSQDIDLIIVATTTPEHIFPSVAVKLQNRINAGNIPAFDIQAACSGFIYALTIAEQFIKTGQYRTVLVVGAEVFSHLIDWRDRSTAVLFGDGAGAVIVQASKEKGIIGSILSSDGKYSQLLWASKGSGCAPCNNDYSPYITMQGREVFKVAVQSLSNLVNQLLDKCQMQADQIDFLVPHQANLRIIKATAQHLNLSMDKVIVTVDKHANTSAASIPLALDYGIRSGQIKKGQNLLLEAFGGGFTWGGLILTY